MITTRGLSYSYSDQKKISFKDFTIHQGEHWLLLGESGSGKTTLLHLLGGLLRTLQGEIVVNDTNIIQLSESALDRFRGQHIGFVFQKNHLITALTVKNNLLIAPFLAGMNQDEKRVDEVLGQLALIEKKNSKIKTLSQGQARWSSNASNQESISGSRPDTSTSRPVTSMTPWPGSRATPPRRKPFQSGCVAMPVNCCPNFIGARRRARSVPIW